MKIIDQTRQNGRHAVLLLAECRADERSIERILEIFTDEPALRAVQMKEAGDRHFSLLLEEIEALDSDPRAEPGEMASAALPASENGS